jgi:hypothetical protein
MGSGLKTKVTATALAPALFWLLATAEDVARRRPDAFETPLAYLAATWLLYLPVFAAAGVLLIGAGRYFRYRHRTSLWCGALGGGGLSLGIAAAVYNLPMRALPLCLAVGAAMGALLARSESAA